MYSSYKYPQSAKSTFRSLDNIFFSLRYLGMASLGKPYMGIRRNLAYRKELFFKNRGGFSGYLYLRDGDDDLFINRVARKENTRVEIAVGSVTRADFYLFDKAWKEQKQAFGITSHFLKNRSSLLFGFESFSRYLFYISATLAFVFCIQNWKLAAIAGTLFVSRYAFQCVIINKSAKLLGEKFHFFSLLIFDIAQPIVDMYYRLSGRLTKNR
jgi:hypothetical protein